LNGIFFSHLWFALGLLLVHAIAEHLETLLDQVTELRLVLILRLLIEHWHEVLSHLGELAKIRLVLTLGLLIEHWHEGLS